MGADVNKVSISETNGQGKLIDWLLANTTTTYDGLGFNSSQEYTYYSAGGNSYKLVLGKNGGLLVFFWIGNKDFIEEIRSQQDLNSFVEQMDKIKSFSDKNGLQVTDDNKAFLDANGFIY